MLALPGFPDDLIQRIDYASATTQYIGFASPGSATSSPVWQIRRVTLDSSGRPTAVLFAGGNANFDNVWDNRALATQSYS